LTIRPQDWPTPFARDLPCVESMQHGQLPRCKGPPDQSGSRCGCFGSKVSLRLAGAAHLRMPSVSFAPVPGNWMQARYPRRQRLVLGLVGDGLGRKQRLKPECGDSVTKVFIDFTSALQVSNHLLDQPNCRMRRHAITAWQCGDRVEPCAVSAFSGSRISRSSVRMPVPTRKTPLTSATSTKSAGSSGMADGRRRSSGGRIADAAA